jgi:hypothetical protein
MPLHLGPHHLAGPQRRARVLHSWHLLRLLLLLWRPELLVRLRCCCCLLLVVHELEFVWAGELVVLLVVHHLRKRHLAVAIAAAGSAETQGFMSWSATKDAHGCSTTASSGACHACLLARQEVQATSANQPKLLG